MTTLFNAAFVLAQIQEWLEGDRRLSLRQLDALYQDAIDMICDGDVSAELAPRVRSLLDKLDWAYERIIAEVGA